MKPTKTLIRGLRETAHKLRQSGVDYRWNSAEACNCGQLAQTLLDMDGVALRVRLSDERCLGSWSINAQRCAQTGLDIRSVIGALRAHGMEDDDFARLEFCHDHDVGHYQSQQAVAAWMDREADELERRRIAERFEEATP
jgi:hypothetical protein